MNWSNPGLQGCLGALVLLVGLVMSAAAVHSQDERVSVRLDGRVLFQVGQGDADSASERAQRIEQRLEILLDAESELQAPVISRGPNDNLTVSVIGVPVATVMVEDAQDNVTTPERLAAQWAAAIEGRRTVLEALKRSAMALPEPDRIIVEHRGSSEEP